MHSLEGRVADGMSKENLNLYVEGHMYRIGVLPAYLFVLLL